MGCHASRTATPATLPARTHRGAPPLKLWVRGAGETAANGTFTRVHPKRARNLRMPKALVVYVNKRGYTLTNAVLSNGMSVPVSFVMWFLNVSGCFVMFKHWPKAPAYFSIALDDG